MLRDVASKPSFWTPTNIPPEPQYAPSLFLFAWYTHGSKSSDHFFGNFLADKGRDVIDYLGRKGTRGHIVGAPDAEVCRHAMARLREDYVGLGTRT